MTPAKLVTAAILLGVLTIPAPAPLAGQSRPEAAPPATVSAIDPVGTFDFLASFGIEARTGTIEIRTGDDGVLVGEVRLQGESEPAVVENVTVDGNQVQIVARVQGQLLVTIDLDFRDADVFSGTIAVPDDSIDIDGRRRAPQ